jgi:hypothetical protein
VIIDVGVVVLVSVGICVLSHTRLGTWMGCSRRKKRRLCDICEFGTYIWHHLSPDWTLNTPTYNFLESEIELDALAWPHNRGADQHTLT